MVSFRNILLLLIITSSSAFAKTPSEAANDYFGMLKDKNYKAAALLFDPSALKEFRQMMGFTDEVSPEAQKQFFTAFFGSESNMKTVSKLSDVEYFSSFLTAVFAQLESVGGVNFDKMEVIGEVMEGNNIAHVVTRTKVSAGEIELESMEVVSFKKSDKEWRALLSGKLKGIAIQLKAAFSKK